MSGGCYVERPASTSHKEPYYETEELEELTSIFLEEADKYGASPNIEGLHISFVEEITGAEPPAVILARCFIGTNVIHIAKKQWAGYDKLGRFLILAHELGHCSLGRGHYVGSNKSIMTAYLPRVRDFKEYYGDYINELFNPSMGLYEDIFDEECYTHP